MAKDHGASEKLISHLRKFRDDPWDEAVFKRTTLCVLDNLGCFCGGLKMPHFSQSAAAMKSVLFPTSRVESSQFLMAYLYGQAAIAMDYDDSLYGHPGSPIIAAILAVASERTLTLDRILRGVAAGYEAHCILCEATEPSSEHSARVRSVGNLDAVAAALGISVALGLPDALMDQVIGVSVAHTIVPYTAKWYERPVPGMKNNTGWIAAGAVLAVNLALEGQTGITRPMEGDRGLWRMIGSDRWNFNDEILSNRPAVLRTGFKHYPACWHTQEYLKSLSVLLDQIASQDDVTDITVFATPDVEKFCDPNIIGTADIAFSLPALFECQIAGIEPGPLWQAFKPGRVDRDFAYVQSDDRRIVVRTRRGHELSAPVELNSMSDGAQYGLDVDGVVAKFSRLASPEMELAARVLLNGEISTNADVGDNSSAQICNVVAKLMN